MNQPNTFFASLFDFSFETFVTGRVIKVLYGLSIVGAALWALFLIVGGFRNSAAWGILMLLIGGPLLFLVSVIYARVLLEIILVIFRISDQTAKLSEDTARLVEMTGRAFPGSAGPQTPPPPPSEPGPPPTQ